MPDFHIGVEANGGGNVLKLVVTALRVRTGRSTQTAYSCIMSFVIHDRPIVNSHRATTAADGDACL